MCAFCCSEVKHVEKQQTVKHVKDLNAFIYYVSICKHTNPTFKNRTKAQWDNNHKESDQTEINSPRFTLNKTYSGEKAHLNITWSGLQLRRCRNKVSNKRAPETHRFFIKNNICCFGASQGVSLHFTITGKGSRLKRNTLETKAKSVSVICHNYQIHQDQFFCLSHL